MLEVGHNDISEKHIISLMPVIILKHQGLECLIEFLARMRLYSLLNVIFLNLCIKKTF